MNPVLAIDSNNPPPHNNITEDQIVRRNSDGSIVVAKKTIPPSKISECVQEIFRKLEEAFNAVCDAFIHTISFLDHSLKHSENIQTVCKLGKSSIAFITKVLKVQSEGLSNLGTVFAGGDTLLDVTGIFGSIKYWINGEYSNDSSLKVTSKAFGTVSRAIGVGLFLVDVGLVKLGHVADALNTIPFFKVALEFSPVKVVKDALGLISAAISIVDSSIKLHKKNVNKEGKIAELKLLKWNIRHQFAHYQASTIEEKNDLLNEFFPETDADEREEIFYANLSIHFKNASNELNKLGISSKHSGELKDSESKNSIEKCQGKWAENAKISQEYNKEQITAFKHEKWKIREEALKYQDLNQEDKDSILKARYPEIADNEREKSYIDDMFERFDNACQGLENLGVLRKNRTNQILVGPSHNFKKCEGKLVIKVQELKDHVVAKRKEWMTIALNVVKIAAIALGLVATFALALSGPVLAGIIGAAWLITSTIGIAKLYHDYRQEENKKNEHKKADKLLNEGEVLRLANEQLENTPDNTQQIVDSDEPAGNEYQDGVVQDDNPVDVQDEEPQVQDEDLGAGEDQVEVEQRRALRMARRQSL